MDKFPLVSPKLLTALKKIPCALFGKSAPSTKRRVFDRLPAARAVLTKKAPRRENFCKILTYWKTQRNSDQLAANLILERKCRAHIFRVRPARWDESLVGLLISANTASSNLPVVKSVVWGGGRFCNPGFLPARSTHFAKLIRPTFFICSVKRTSPNPMPAVWRRGEQPHVLL